MRIAILGTGLLGTALVERLLALGHKPTVYNRTPARAEPLAALGAGVVPTPEQAIAAADFIILMLSDAAAIREAALAPARRADTGGKIFLQMGTIAPAESVELAEAFHEVGADYVEAPVLGSLPEARAGTLIVMFGGPEEQFTRCAALLRLFSAEPVRIGAIGQAAAMKLALNQLIAALTAGFSLSLAWVEKNAIPVELFMQLLRGSALYAPTFDKKLKRMCERDFGAPNFPTKHLLKDVELYRAAAEAVDLDASALAAIGHILEKTVAAGLGDADYSAIHQTISSKS